MYSYVISEDSTRFPPAAAHAEYQQVVSAGDSPLIFTLSSTHNAEKPISIGECWLVIGWCKKLNNEVVSHQRTQPFIIWCSQEKHHSVPCFGRGQPGWPLPQVWYPEHLY